MHEKEPVTLARRFLSVCLTVFAGVLLLYLTVQLLGQFWGWLLLIFGIGLILCVGVIAWRYWWGRRF